MKRIYGMVVLASLFALAATAQDADMKMKKELDEALTSLKQMTVMRMEGGVMSNVKNAPYRADQITETTQTLGDGTRIHNEHRVTVYRDSQGRTRRETPDEISIMDPNSGVGYVLHPNDMTYRKMAVSVSVNAGAAGAGFYTFRTQAGTASAMAGGGRGFVDMPVVTFSKTLTLGSEGASLTLNDKTFDMTPNKENLGMQTMEGVRAQGERRTSTIEAGAIGNDRPIQIVSERWYSPDLQMDVMTRHSDPRAGEDTMRLIDINRSEPDASLFAVPAGYQLIEGPAGKGGRGGR